MSVSTGKIAMATMVLTAAAALTGCVTMEDKAERKEQYLSEGKSCRGGYAPTGTRIKRCDSADDVRAISGDAVRRMDRSPAATSRSGLTGRPEDGGGPPGD